jgi:D-alanyl-lipoteichoic acid acyltransferase DltB (MBOAT superfamily)
MAFNSFIFIIFLIFVVPLYYIFPQKFRNAFILAVSYAFYAYSDFRYIGLLLIIIAATFIAGKKIYDTDNFNMKRIYLALITIIDLTILGAFKYFNFFIDSTSDLLSVFGYQLDFVHLNIILPLGISFYTFQALTYVFDIYYEQLKPTKSVLNFALFVSFFPSITAGPIERATRLLPQFEKEKRFDRSKIKEGIILISIGMFRKVLIGDTCGRIVDHIFAEPEYFLSLELLMAVLLFAIQIYNDFAGYSSIARGIAKLFGIDIIENFNQPYFSASVTEFWRRWHISLSTWLRDYLFSPLQMKYRRLRVWGNALAIFITFVLCGLWHGAAWTFVFWGFLHALSLSLSILFQSKRKTILSKYSILNSRPAHFLKVFYTFTLITIFWIFFRADSFDNAIYFIANIIDWSGAEFTFRIVLIVLTYYVVSYCIDLLEIRFKSHAFLLKINPPLRYAFISVSWLIVLMYLFTSNQIPFIYAQF